MYLSVNLALATPALAERRGVQKTSCRTQVVLEERPTVDFFFAIAIVVAVAAHFGMDNLPVCSHGGLPPCGLFGAVNPRREGYGTLLPRMRPRPAIYTVRSFLYDRRPCRRSPRIRHTLYAPLRIVSAEMSDRYVRLLTADAVLTLTICSQDVDVPSMGRAVDDASATLPQSCSIIIGCYAGRYL